MICKVLITCYKKQTTQFKDKLTLPSQSVSAMSSHVELLVFFPLLLHTVAGGNISGTCDDIVKNENCDGRYGVIVWYDDVIDGADCQYRCNQLEEAQ